MEILSRIIKNAYKELESLDKESNEYKTSKKIVDYLNVFNKTHNVTEQVSSVFSKITDTFSDLTEKFRKPVHTPSALDCEIVERDNIIVLTLYLPGLSPQANVTLKGDMLTIITDNLSDYVKCKYNIENSIDIVVPKHSTASKPFASCEHKIGNGVLTMNIVYHTSIVDDAKNLFKNIFGKK
jgi:HSP20 family molecular chaperone IbpA